jgi:hypothetical protein
MILSRCGAAFAEVVLVTFEHHSLAERPLGHLVSAGADRIAAEVGAVFLDFLARHREGEVDGDDLQEGRVGLGQLDDHGLVVGGGDAGQLLGIARGHLVESLDLPEEALARALGLRIDRALDRVFHVGRGQVAAVVELDAGTEFEGVDETVLGDGVALGQVGNQLRGARLVVHQAVEQALDHGPVLPVVADRRIEGADVVLVGDDHLAAVAAVLGQRRSAVAQRENQSERGRRAP